MAYIGPAPNPGQNREVDDISSGFNGGTASFTLQVNGQNVSPGSANAIIVSLGGVVQNPGTDYTIAASTITFTTNPPSGLSFFGLVLGQGIDTQTIADGQSPTMAAPSITGDLSIADKIVHTGDTNTAIRFPAADTVSVETGGSERARIDSSGRVLIGTTTVGDSSSDDLIVSSSAGTGMTIRSGSSNNGIIHFADATSGGGEYVGAILYSHSSNHMRFDTNGSESLRINDNGDIRFGNATGSNTYAPHTNNGGTSSGVMFNAGTDAANYAIDAQSDSIVLICNKTQGNGVAIEIKKDATVVGSITISGSDTAYNTNSDYRLKENVVNINDGITRVKQLIPRRFNWISDDTNTLQDGFLAHEVQSVVPEAVQGVKDEIAGADYKGHSGISEGDPVYQEMDHSKLVPLLTAALQEAVTKIETLETKVAALEAA